MGNYSAHWPATILAAVGLHVAGAFGFSYVAENFLPEQKVQQVIEIEWVDADFSADEATVDEPEIFSDAPAENSSPFSAEDLVVPEIEIPAPKIEPTKPIEVKPVERPKPPPKVDEPPKVEPPKKIDEPPKEEVAQKLAKPPVTVTQVQPEIPAAENVSGFVAIAARIGKDGKVKSTEILQSCGKPAVDEIAVAAAKQWTFQPALDQIGRPMECDKIITFDLRKP